MNSYLYLYNVRVTISGEQPLISEIRDELQLDFLGGATADVSSPEFGVYDITLALSGEVEDDYLIDCVVEALSDPVGESTVTCTITAA